MELTLSIRHEFVKLYSMANSKLSKSWVTVTPLSKMLALLLFIFLPFIGFYLGMQYQKSQMPLGQTKLAYKTYADPEGYISFQYPENWRIDFSGKAQDDVDTSLEFKKKKDITVGGKEGKINIYWVDGYGGACGKDYEKIKLGNLTANVCHYTEGDNTEGESWTQISEQLEESTNIGVNIEAFAEEPAEQNREVILKILSSLKLNKTN